MIKIVGWVLTLFIAYHGYTSIAYSTRDSRMALVFALFIACPLFWKWVSGYDKIKIPPIIPLGISAIAFFIAIYQMESNASAKAEELGLGAGKDYIEMKGKGLTLEQYKKEQEACRENVRCWSEKHTSKAELACKPLIERSARFDAKWTTSLTRPTFYRAYWIDKEKDIMAYMGNEVQFQNELGNYIPHRYTCIYNPTLKTAQILTVRPGRE